MHQRPSKASDGWDSRPYLAVLRGKRLIKASDGWDSRPYLAVLRGKRPIKTSDGWDSRPYLAAAGRMVLRLRSGLTPLRMTEF